MLAGPSALPSVASAPQVYLLADRFASSATCQQLSSYDHSPTAKKPPSFENRSLPPPLALGNFPGHCPPAWTTDWGTRNAEAQPDMLSKCCIRIPAPILMTRSTPLAAPTFPLTVFLTALGDPCRPSTHMQHTEAAHNWVALHFCGTEWYGHKVKCNNIVLSAWQV